MTATITPPGKGRIVRCPDCNGVPGRDCLECRGQGRFIRRACPLCGDPGWDHVNGTDDRNGMACRISCGYTWTAEPMRGSPRPMSGRALSPAARAATTGRPSRAGPWDGTTSR